MRKIFAMLTFFIYRCEMMKSPNKSLTATGNSWLLRHDDPATVPVPLPVIIVNIHGPFTERDRKLWVFLLHVVWDHLETNAIHEVPVQDICRVFRELGGDRSNGWIWESAQRLTRSIVEWEQTEADHRYRGISSLFSAAITDDARENGILRFAFPALLVPILKDPGRFARLRVHFMMGLSGKYAVTLYELLESVANRREPQVKVELSELRRWLKVPEGKLTRYQDLRRFVLEPAVAQINDDPVAAGFSVEVEALKAGRSVRAIRFRLTKTAERETLEARLQTYGESLGRTKSEPMRIVRDDPANLVAARMLSLPTAAFEKARQIAPDFDVYALEQEWRVWQAEKPVPDNPEKAFLGFCRRKQKERSH